MSNVSSSNTVHGDTTGLLKTGLCKVCYLIFTPNGPSATLQLSDGINTGGFTKLKLKADNNSSTIILDMTTRPMLFGQGVYLEQITAGSYVTMLTTEGGG